MGSLLVLISTGRGRRRVETIKIIRGRLIVATLGRYVSTVQRIPALLANVTNLEDQI